MPVSRRDKALQKGIGERLRWIREAYEAREPLQHGLEQWAKSLGISTAKLSRIENGQQGATLDLIDNICWTTGSSIDFVFWRVLSPSMEGWLADALRAAHPTRILEWQDFLKDRAKTLKTATLRREPRQRRQRRQRRPGTLEI